jgi:hypothetical protein
MKRVRLALITAFAIAGYGGAQAPAQTAPPPPAKSDQASAAPGHPTSKACKKEVKDLCGRRAKGEEPSCIKDGLDLNKFSADCKAELTGAAKPGP